MQLVNNNRRTLVHWCVFLLNNRLLIPAPVSSEIKVKSTWKQTVDTCPTEENGGITAFKTELEKTLSTAITTEGTSYEITSITCSSARRRRRQTTPKTVTSDFYIVQKVTTTGSGNSSSQLAAAGSILNSVTSSLKEAITSGNLTMVVSGYNITAAPDPFVTSDPEPLSCPTNFTLNPTSLQCGKYIDNVEIKKTIL